jgi:hypothetical protein
MAPHGLREFSIEPSFRLIYRSNVEVDPPMIVGGTTYGERRIILIKGGAFV